MTNTRKRIEREDTNIVFGRKKGGVWHVVHPSGKRGECSVDLSDIHSERRYKPHGLGDCCTRRGCREMFEYVDMNEGWIWPGEDIE